ncbi:Phosphatase NudJ [Marinomonas aquimarina]|uniref:Phosphatase NudJ n=1 Tax=Marinomonas aquimarina TaxID=295068 RepID=A0A1A8T4D1_9GAMM|nr:NUDIX domain-containing protein [Marinomonas aquimarina]SBS26801.1 Phosphatase NudJ [Marinomonas aquimarina]
MQDGQIVLNQPAGHVENGETIEQAVMRETLEESGWQVTPEAILGIYAFTPFAGADTYHRICVICRPEQLVTQALDPDILSADWFSRAEIEALPQRSPLIMQCIQDYENGQRHDINMINNHHIKVN